MQITPITPLNLPVDAAAPSSITEIVEETLLKAPNKSLQRWLKYEQSQSNKFSPKMRAAHSPIKPNLAHSLLRLRCTMSEPFSQNSTFTALRLSWKTFSEQHPELFTPSPKISYPLRNRSLDVCVNSTTADHVAFWGQVGHIQVFADRMSLPNLRTLNLSLVLEGLAIAIPILMLMLRGSNPVRSLGDVVVSLLIVVTLIFTHFIKKASICRGIEFRILHTPADPEISKAWQNKDDIQSKALETLIKTTGKQVLFRKLHPQKVKNCSWTSIKAGLLGMLVANHLHANAAFVEKNGKLDESAQVKNRTVRQPVDDVVLVYKKWSLWDRVHGLQDYRDSIAPWRQYTNDPEDIAKVRKLSQNALKNIEQYAQKRRGGDWEAYAQPLLEAARQYNQDIQTTWGKQLA